MGKNGHDTPLDLKIGKNCIDYCIDWHGHKEQSAKKH